MGTSWRATAWLIAVAVLQLRLTWAVQHDRQLAQDDAGPQPVSTAEELKHAIINQIANIHFTGNFTFPEETFPGTESFCCPHNYASCCKLMIVPHLLQACLSRGSVVAKQLLRL